MRTRPTHKIDELVFELAGLSLSEHREKTALAMQIRRELLPDFETIFDRFEDEDIVIDELTLELGSYPFNGQWVDIRNDIEKRLYAALEMLLAEKHQGNHRSGRDSKKLYRSRDDDTRLSESAPGHTVGQIDDKELVRPAVPIWKTHNEILSLLPIQAIHQSSLLTTRSGNTNCAIELVATAIELNLENYDAQRSLLSTLAEIVALTGTAPAQLLSQRLLDVLAKALPDSSRSENHNVSDSTYSNQQADSLATDSVLNFDEGSAVDQSSRQDEMDSVAINKVTHSDTLLNDPVRRQKPVSQTNHNDTELTARDRRQTVPVIEASLDPAVNAEIEESVKDDFWPDPSQVITTGEDDILVSDTLIASVLNGTESHLEVGLEDDTSDVVNDSASHGATVTRQSESRGDSRQTSKPMTIQYDKINSPTAAPANNKPEFTDRADAEHLAHRAYKQNEPSKGTAQHSSGPVKLRDTSANSPDQIDLDKNNDHALTQAVFSQVQGSMSRGVESKDGTSKISTFLNEDEQHVFSGDIDNDEDVAIKSKLSAHFTEETYIFSQHNSLSDIKDITADVSKLNNLITEIPGVSSVPGDKILQKKERVNVNNADGSDDSGVQQTQGTKNVRGTGEYSSNKPELDTVLQCDRNAIEEVMRSGPEEIICDAFDVLNAGTSNKPFKSETLTSGALAQILIETALPESAQILRSTLHAAMLDSPNPVLYAANAIITIANNDMIAPDKLTVSAAQLTHSVTVDLISELAIQGMAIEELTGIAMALADNAELPVTVSDAIQQSRYSSFSDVVKNSPAQLVEILCKLDSVALHKSLSADPRAAVMLANLPNPAFDSLTRHINVLWDKKHGTVLRTLRNILDPVEQQALKVYGIKSVVNLKSQRNNLSEFIQQALLETTDSFEDAEALATKAIKELRGNFKEDVPVIVSALDIFITNETRPARMLETSVSGLILLAPFLATLFERCGLTQQNAFLSDQAQVQAARLLTIVCYGKDAAMQHCGPLERCLVNLPANAETGQIDQADENTIKLIESLLSTVCERWPPLTKTSAQGLRETFLVRTGLLEFKPEIILTVERKTVDVLLDSLPWSFGQIRLPWLAEVLTVSWQPNS